MKKLNLDYILKRRKELGLTQLQVAQKMNLKSRDALYQRYEKGKYRLRADMLPRLANALQCQINDFFEDGEE